MKQSLLSRILLPTMIVLLILPPLSCYIFQQAADRYASAEASDDLHSLQQNILPLIRRNFENQGYESNVDTSQQVLTFLSQVAPIVHRMGGNAQLMIFGSRMQLVYPHDDQDREMVASLAKEFAQYIQTTNIPKNNPVIAFESFNGDKYLVKFYEIPTQSMQLKYIVTYCSTSQISAWVNQASFMVLIISSVFALLAITVLLMTAHSISQPLHRLCREAKEIGYGNFSDIQPPLSLRELDELRLAMNEMSIQLMSSDNIQRNFFQNVSHELRNPLMSISGYAQGIAQGVFKSPKEAANTILEESVRLTDLVNSLLTLSRMESGQNPPLLSQILLIDSIEDCLDRAHGLALQKGISFSVVPFNKKITLLGEEELLGKVLDNLLTNAIRYAKTTVTVKVIEKKGRIAISVSDDGDGISEKDLPHIFERCYKGKGGNFGLGLSIARTAALSMNGELTAANCAQGGAIFTLILQQ